MTKNWWAFWYAMAFLTRIPTPYLQRTDQNVAATSLLYYPVIGALLGLVLLALCALCVSYNTDVSLPLLSALLLACWVGFTGALHLDGLADSMDAWVGGLGDRERALAIMKDPQSGPMGVTAIVVLLLIKWAAIYALLQQASHNSQWNIWLLMGGLLLVPMLARASVLGIMATTPYARAHGLVSPLLTGATPLRIAIMGSILALLAGILLQTQALFILLLWLTLAAMARHCAKQRLGGYTGDTLGAGIEVQEALLLAAIAL